MKQTVVIYARISTNKQNHDSQLTELREYCARRKWEEVEEIVDTAAGVKSSREGLDRLMKAVRRGKIAIIAYSDASWGAPWCSVYIYAESSPNTT
jgi:DNA invertase Pin-like site-specific DNA recombinase